MLSLAFFGHLPVEQAKGIDVVKDAIRKLQFAQQMKKAETGTQEKYKKVEITISVDGVAVQEPRTQNILHQFPLHNISYCADEKGVKKFFSFIAKTVIPHPTNGSNTQNGLSNGTGSQKSNNSEETHECFIFISNKLASDITLTIGQAFDLAYKKFINNAEKTDLGKAQQRIAELERNVNIYKNRLRELSLKVSKTDLDKFLLKMSIKDILDVPKSEVAQENGNNQLDEDKLLIDTNSTKSSNSITSFAPMVPPRNNISSQNISKSNSQKLEELLLNSDSDSDFDPRAEESFDNGNKNNESGNSNISGDIFGFEPSKSYGQQLFLNNNDNKVLINNNNKNNNNNNNNNTLSSNSFTNELHVRPPLLAPPPKVAAPRRSISVTTTTTNANAIHHTNGNIDLFGSDPFDISTSSNNFKNKLSSISVDDFSLESLDPLKK